ncbi:hypothetical protein D3C77_576810 [compost metagenome]
MFRYVLEKSQKNRIGRMKRRNKCGRSRTASNGLGEQVQFIRNHFLQQVRFVNEMGVERRSVDIRFFRNIDHTDFLIRLPMQQTQERLINHPPCTDNSPIYCPKTTHPNHLIDNSLVF